MTDNKFDWRKVQNWKFPFKNGIRSEAYKKSRDEFFEGHNGWWWGDGWWNGKHESSMERQRRYRERNAW